MIPVNTNVRTLAVRAFPRLPKGYNGTVIAHAGSLYNVVDVPGVNAPPHNDPDLPAGWLLADDEVLVVHTGARKQEEKEAVLA